MRNAYISKFVFLCLFIFSGSSTVFSCNLSNYSLISITGTGPYTIVTQLCVGGGITGGVTGADGDTWDILFALYSTDPTFSISSFTPSGLSAIFTGGYLPGFDVGALGAPFDSQGNIYYEYDPFTYPGGPYACINSTALCGNVISQCTNITFVTNVRPDSIRVFGVEGAGNPIAGCYPNPDMLISFNLLLPVFWSTVNAKKITDRKVVVNWTTLSEVENNFFTVEKTDELIEGINHHNQQEDMTAWITCGIVNGTNTNSKKDYSFTDDNPFPGLSYYRIKQTDYSGKFSYSNIVVAPSVSENENINIRIYPNPSNSILNVEYDGLKNLTLVNLLGEKIYENNVTAINAHHSINIQNIPEGLYLLKVIKLNNEVLSFKIKIVH